MYEFRVKAVNGVGESEPSLPLNVVIQDDEGMGFISNATHALSGDLGNSLKTSALLTSALLTSLCSSSGY